MIRYRGITVITSDKVYVPAEDTFLAAEVLEDQIKKSRGNELDVLDMGTGTGILGIIAAQNEKIRKVVFADSNKNAINLCNENITFNNGIIKAECKITESELFSKIRDKFDIMIFNAPYLRSEEGDKKDGELAKAWSGGPEGIEISVKFLQDSLAHLKPNGIILLVASSHSNLERLKSEAKSIGLKTESRKSTHIFFEDIICFVFSRG